MPFNYEIPRITQRDEQSPESISPIYDDTSWEDDRTAIQKGHYWKRVFSTSVFCNQKVNVRFTTKIGVSQSLVKETSASLDIPIHALKATLGSKISQTDLLNREDTVEMTREISAKECDAVTFAEWQRCDRFEITRFGNFLRRTRTHRLDIPLHDTYPDHLQYSDPECCPAKFDGKVKQGYDQVYTITIPEKTFAILAKVLSSGQIQLDGLSGVFSPAQTILTADFPDFFDSTEQAPVAVIGRHSHGTVGEFYSLRASRRSKFHVLPWLIAAASGYLIHSILEHRRYHDDFKTPEARSEPFVRQNQSPQVSERPVERV